MPLKIRCPHCRRVLVAEDEVAGQRKLCPACGRQFDVPERLSEVPAAHVTMPKCPQCGTEVAPTAHHCHKCFTNLQTGKRLPLKRRLGLMPWRVWATGVFAVAIVALIVITGVRFYTIRSQPPSPTFDPTVPKPIPTAALAAKLFDATSAEQRQAALRDLGGVEARTAPAVAEALAASLDEPGNEQARRNRIAAIDLLARNAAAHGGALSQWLELLERCQQDRGLRDAALRGRALLGDARVLDELAELWLNRLERTLFLARVTQHTGAADGPGAGVVPQRARAELARCADGLRHLAQDPDNLVFERLAKAYWDSWRWLGQGPGDGFAQELFELARPAGTTLEFRPDDVRKPRDVLKRVTERGSPAARAAAGLVLKERVPQYLTLSERIADALGELLPDSAPLDQQRLTWTISRLRGKLFGAHARGGPLEVTRAEVAAAQRWLRPDVPPVLAASYAAPPTLVYRAVTVERQLERDLLAEFRRGWVAANSALDRWLAADLGCTPRLDALLDPGQRRPSYPALASAMVIVARGDARRYRPQLELWREATDQEPWVRALAYSVLGSFDARTGHWTSGWPLGLDLGDPALLDAGMPGWEYFGRVLAAGGPAMLDRLENLDPAPLPEAIQSRLSDAARRAAERPAQPPGP